MVWRSRSSVVAGPCPDATTVSPGNASISRRMLATSVSMSPPSRSVRPMLPANSTSPEKTMPSVAYAIDAGEWPGTEKVRNSIPAIPTVSSPSSRCCGSYGASWCSRSLSASPRGAQTSTS